MIRRYQRTQSGQPGMRYSEEFKRHLIEEYPNGTANKKFLLAKYGVRAKGSFQQCMRELGYADIRMVAAGAKPVTLQSMKPSK